jgi:hypothetical protein
MGIACLTTSSVVHLRHEPIVGCHQRFSIHSRTLGADGVAKKAVEWKTCSMSRMHRDGGEKAEILAAY